MNAKLLDMRDMSKTERLETELKILKQALNKLNKLSRGLANVHNACLAIEREIDDVTKILNNASKAE